MRYLLLKTVFRLFDLATRFLVKPMASPAQNREVLRRFLEWDRTQRQHWIATFSFPLFDGIHPKNIFATRIEDLRSEVDTFSITPLRVLDFGCGSGRTLELLAPRISAGLGIDLREPTNGGHAEVRKKNPQIAFEYREHTPETLTASVRTFRPDLVVLSHVLEHLENPVEFLKAFHPVPILVCVPSEESWLQALRKDLGLPTSSDSTHFREYTRAGAAEELREAGYQTGKIRFNPEGELVFVARPR